MPTLAATSRRIKPQTTSLSDYHSLIATLGGDPRSGMCRCPAHDDANPSLHLTLKDGKLLAKCHAGCDQASVWAALGLKGRRALRPRRPEYNREHEDYHRFRRALSVLRGKPDEPAFDVMPYYSARGLDLIPPAPITLSGDDTRRIHGLRAPGAPAIVLPVVKGDRLAGCHLTFLDHDRKVRIARQTLGLIKGGYIRLSLEPLPGPLLIGEGVETVLAAMQITGLPGIAAIAAPFLKTVEPPPPGGLINEVIIAADNDNAGIEAAETLATRLSALKYTVRIATPEHGDWNDALRDRTGDPAILRQRIVDAPIFTGRRLPQPPTMIDFLAEDHPPRRTLLAPWLPEHGVVMIHGPSGVGKTRLLLSTAHALALGVDLMGWKVLEAVRVLYVDGELPVSVLKSRVKQLPGATANLIVLSREQYLTDHGVDIGDLASQEGRDILTAIIEDCQAQVIVLDSLATLAGLTNLDKEAEVWEGIQNWMMWEHRVKGRTIVLAHHNNKAGQLSGFIHKTIVLDTVISLKPAASDEEGDETTVQVSFDKHREFYGPAAQPVIISFATTSGVLEWSHQTARAANADRIHELSREGMKAAAIARELQVSAPYVSKVLRKGP